MDETSVWRPSRPALVGVSLSVVVLAAVLIPVTASIAAEGFLLDAVVVAALGIAVAALVVRYLARCRVLCSSDGVEIVRLFSRRKASWQEIRGARPTYSGVVIYLSDGGRMKASTVQKANLSVWMKRRTRADVLADLINDRAEGPDGMGLPGIP